MFELPISDVLKADYFDLAPAIIAIIDTDHNIIWANKAYLNATGRSLDEIQGKKCYSAWQLDKPCRGCPVTISIDTCEQHEDELTPQNQDHWPHGQCAWLVKAVPVKDATGTIIGSVETILELTEHVTQLRRYEKTTAALMRLLEYTTGHTAMELLRKFLDEAEALTGSQIGFYHFVEDDQETLSLQMWSTNTLKTCSAPGAGTMYPIRQAGVWVDCVRQGAPVIHNDYASLPHKKGLPEGHVPVVRELVVPVVRAGKLEAILGVGNKETDYDEHDVRVVEQLAKMAWEAIVRKRAEEENRKLQEQFAQAQKMEAVGRLAGGVAHDFNNMLSLISGYAELSLDEVDQSEPIYANLKEILSAAKRSADITRQLLAFARQQAIVPKVVDLNAVVEGMLKMLRRLIGEDIDLAWNPRPELWPVKIDPTQIDQLLANLCVNARDAIADVGKITIETKNVVFDEAYCADHVAFVPGRYVMLAVSDDGCGMDKATLDQIFEPFFTTKKLGKGTGLGLATVYGIVKQNGGFVNVYSEPGEGTTFHLYLSRHPGKADKIDKQRTDEVQYGNGETVLVVEDEVSILNLTRKFLEGLGYSVLVAGTPKDAIRLAEKYTGKIQLLITDVVMPEMNGRDLAARLELLSPNLKCLFMSGYTANVIVHRGVLDEGVNFIQKPVSKKDLAVKVREVLGKDG